MSQTHVWTSIALWAVFAIGTAIVVSLVLGALYPALHFGVLALAGMLSVFAVYALRDFARRRGWAIASYAPQNK